MPSAATSAACVDSGASCSVRSATHSLTDTPRASTARANSAETWLETKRIQKPRWASSGLTGSGEAFFNWFP